MALFSSQMTTKICTMKLPLFTSLNWDSKELEDVIISVITLAQGNSKHTQRVTQVWDVRMAIRDNVSVLTKCGLTIVDVEN